MLKVILFDIDNTLLSFNAYAKESMKSGFEKFEIGTYEDRMFSVFNQINTDLWQLIEKGKLDFKELQKKRWNMIFEYLGISADGIAFEKYFQECLFESAIPRKRCNGIGEISTQQIYSLCCQQRSLYAASEQTENKRNAAIFFRFVYLRRNRQFKTF